MACANKFSNKSFISTSIYKPTVTKRYLCYITIISYQDEGLNFGIAQTSPLSIFAVIL